MYYRISNKGISVYKEKDALERRIKALEEVSVKIFELILHLTTGLVVLFIAIAIIAICWFLGITSDSSISYFKEFAKTPVWLIFLAVIGFFGISYWSLLKTLHKLAWNYYWDKVVLRFLESLD